jgi:hypothetical protein
MMADETSTKATETAEDTAPAETAAASETPSAETVSEAGKAAASEAEADKSAASEAEAPPAAEAAPALKKAAAPEPEEEPEPVPDPDTCKGIAIGLPAFWEGIHAGEWDGSDFEYYLEPAGILNGPLHCSRAPEGDPQRAGLLMTRAGWKAKTLFLDDDINPDTYELSFPKEFGYVKPLAHYKEETREHAQFPWSKKY